MDRVTKRFIRILEEMKDLILDKFSETADILEKEFSEEIFKKLSVGMKVRNDLGSEGVITKIDGIHSVTVQYPSHMVIHCMDDSCFHYERIMPLEDTKVGGI